MATPRITFSSWSPCFHLYHYFYPVRVRGVHSSTALDVMPAPLQSVFGAAPSFVAPLPCSRAFRSANVSTCPRIARRRGRQPGRGRVWLACTNEPLPEEEKPDGENLSDDLKITGAVQDAEDTESTDHADRVQARIESITGTTLAEIDELAEEWIGADLSRWEWYERVKARRKRMLKVGQENEESFDKELQELKRTFMEIDAIFGTRMLDESSEISAAGWSTVAIITMLYVCAGFWAFELVVRLLTTVTPSFP